MDDSSAIPVGEMALLEITNPSPENRLLREMAGNVAGAADYPWHETLLDGVTWSWPVVVTHRLSPRTIRIEQPLRVAIGPNTRARLRDWFQPCTTVASNT